MLRRHLTPSLIISLLALFIATSGASYAALSIPKNSVGTKQIKKSAVTTKKLKKSAVTSSKVKNGSLLSEDFASGQLPQGPQGPQGAQGERGPSDAYRSERVGALLNLTNAFQPVVTTQTLPAGSYVLWSRANVLANGGAGSVICSIENDAAQNVTLLAANAVVAIAQTATVTLDSPQTVTLNCLKQSGAPQVAQATITAIRVGTLTSS